MQLQDFGKTTVAQEPPAQALDTELDLVLTEEDEETPETAPESELVASSGDFDPDDVYNSLDEPDQAIWDGVARS